MTLNTTNPHCFTYQTEELLIELLGGVRIDGLDRMRETIKKTRKEKVLSKEERETAIQFLEQNDLLNRTNERIGKSGVIKEEANRLLMYLIFTSRKGFNTLGIMDTYVNGPGLIRNPVSGIKHELSNGFDIPLPHSKDYYLNRNFNLYAEFPKAPIPAKK